MASYFLRRLLLVPVTFLAITFLIYAVLRLVPGGPIEQAEARQKLAAMREGGGTSIGIGADTDVQLDEDALRELQSFYALDRPIPIGYLQWLGLWPREKRRPVPPRAGNGPAIERLLAATAAIETAGIENAAEGPPAADLESRLASIEEETGLFLRNSRIPTRIAFRPLIDLAGARARAGERLDDLLGERIEEEGRFYRPATPGDEAAHAPILERAKDLVEGGFARRPDLLEFLRPRGLTWRNNRFYVALTPAEVAAEPETFAEANRLVDASRLASEKLARVREEAGYEVTGDGRLDRIESRLSGVLQLDFGQSYTYSEPVLGLIGGKMEVSLQFGLIGYLLTWLVCVPLGVMKAVKHRTGFDSASSILVFLGYSVPGFVLCLLLLSTLAVNVDWIPLGGYKPSNIEDLPFFEALIGRVRHMLIPVAGYTIGGFAAMTILMKNSLLENLGQDYVRTAFAKGLTERRVIFVHAFRNSLIPITAGIGHALGILFAGSVLIEKVCNIDGMGLLGYEAIVQRDYPIILGMQVFLVMIALFGNVLSDLIWALIDPRIRFGN